MRRFIADLPQYEQVDMFIPEHACGYLIGKNGATIREIRDSSKARLNMDRKMIDNVENKRFNRLVISGTAEQISTAKVGRTRSLSTHRPPIPALVQSLIEERLGQLDRKQQGDDHRSFTDRVG